MSEGTTDKAASSGAVASTGATSSGNVTSGTASAAMLRAVEASSASSDPAAKPAEQTPASAAASGTAPGAPAQVTPEVKAAATAKGPIPFEDHQRALNNARDKAIEQFAWAKGLDPKAVKQALGLLNELRTDSKSFWQRLGQRINAGAATEEKFPEADLTGEGGVKAYSDVAIKKALDIHGKQVQAAILAKLQPIMEFYQTEQTSRAEEGRKAENAKLSAQVLAEARQSPRFKENEAAIKAEMEAMVEADPSLVETTAGAIRVLYRAYQKVLDEKVFPGIDEAAAAKVRESNKRKAATSEGTVHPTQPQGEGKPAELKNASDLARHMERLAETATA